MTPIFLCKVDSALSYFSDLEGAFSEDEALRRALAQQIRMACMDVGFFYSTPSLVSVCLTFCNVNSSQEPWHSTALSRRSPESEPRILFASS
jgi:hypothetical protein